MFSECNIDSGKEIKDCKRRVKQIVKTSYSISKKYCALKTGKIEEDITLEKHFKLIVESLKQIVENRGKESQPIKKEANIAKDKNIKKKHKDNDDDNDEFWMDDGWLKLMPQPKKQCTKQLNRWIHPF